MTSAPTVASTDAPPADRATRPPRIVGLDLARSLAILGMFIVHAVGIWAIADTGWARTVEHHLEGRSMPLFLVLAGAGLDLMLRSTEKPWRTMIGRSAVLLLLGMWLGGHTAVAVIIPFYAAYLLVGTALRRLSETRLLLAAAAILGVGTVLRFHSDRFPATPDSWGPMWLGRLDDLRRPLAVLSELFVTGTYPVLPAGSLVVLGMWVSRRLRHHPTVEGRRRLAVRLAIAGVALVGVTGIAAAVTHGPRQDAIVQQKLWDAEQEGGTVAQMLEEQAQQAGMTVDEMLVKEAAVTGQDIDELRAMVETVPAERVLWPWMIANTDAHSEFPGWLLSSAGSSLVVIALCLVVADGRRGRRAVEAFAPLGRSSLSAYALHVGAIWVLLRAHPDEISAPAALAGAVAAWGGLVVLALLWTRRFGPAPLERLIRAAGRRAASPLRVAPALDDRHIGDEPHR